MSNEFVHNETKHVDQLSLNSLRQLEQLETNMKNVICEIESVTL